MYFLVLYPLNTQQLNCNITNTLNNSNNNRYKLNFREISDRCDLKTKTKWRAALTKATRIKTINRSRGTPGSGLTHSSHPPLYNEGGESRISDDSFRTGCDGQGVGINKRIRFGKERT